MPWLGGSRGTLSLEGWDCDLFDRGVESLGFREAASPGTGVTG